MLRRILAFPFAAFGDLLIILGIAIWTFSTTIYLPPKDKIL